MKKPIILSSLAVSFAGFFGVLVVSTSVEAEYYETPPDFSSLNLASFNADAAPLNGKIRAQMIPIPAGIYPIGRNTGPDDERPAHEVKLDGFKIDKNEVTNGAFAEFLNAIKDDVTARLIEERRRGEGYYPLIALDDEQARITYNQGRFEAWSGYENHPVAETTWAGALAYCAWRGDRLPSEVEWEAAARGADGHLYPWGDNAPRNDQVFISNRSGVTGEVGQRPTGASPFGVLDMSASLAEWTASIKKPYPYDAMDGREDPRRAGERVTRGGDYVYDTNARTLTTSFRDGFSNAPHRGHRHIGFRCAH